jgi:hypothetical protein
MNRVFALAAIVALLLNAKGQNPPSHDASVVTYDGANWHLKGEGIVACPCRVPCPCRTNAPSTFHHCEATLYLHVRKGHYGPVKLDDLQVVNIGGSCAMSHEHFAALYFSNETTPEQQSSFLKLMASFLPSQSTEFPYVRKVQINAQVTRNSYYQVSIPGILQMVVDRNWGRSEPPMPMVAATDYFSNLLQYAQNLRYVMRDDEANLSFDYSRRQANYRDIDLDADHYRSNLMLIQFQDGSGWFNADQQRLIHQLKLPLPDLPATRKLFVRLSDPYASEESSDAVPAREGDKGDH